jgi:hypothetical protein
LRIRLAVANHLISAAGETLGPSKSFERRLRFETDF